MDDVFRYEIKYVNEQKTTFTYYVYTKSDLITVVKEIKNKGFLPLIRKQRLCGFRQKALKVEAV